MKKIMLDNYPVILDDGTEQGYAVRESIVNMLFNPELRLDAVELLKTNALATRILDAPDVLLLEDADYAKIERACKVVKGYTRNDVELVTRILEAPDVEIKEA